MTHEQQIIEAVKGVMPAVVSITAAKDLEVLRRAYPFSPYGYPPPDELFDPEKLAQEGVPLTDEGKLRLGGGSGFFVHKDGIILTNRHVVIDPEAEYSIVTTKEETLPVKVLARDPIHDIAILKVEMSGKERQSRPTVPFCSNDTLELGQTVIAIGNALGEFRNSVSTGVVSGLSRLISAITDMAGHQERLRGLIQTDAAINPGNSGGPLVNLAGEVIGVNAAIVFGAQNIGFAIPIKKAHRDLKEINKFGRIRRPFLGVRYIVLNKGVAKRFGLPADYGALILKEAIPGDHAVVPGSAADKSGLREGDIILTCNKKKITETETLEDMLEGFEVGQKIMLELLRGGKEKKAAEVTLAEHA